MTKKDFIYAMGNIDPSFIERAAPGEKLPKRKMNAFVRWGSLVAGICTLLIVCIILNHVMLPEVQRVFSEAPMFYGDSFAEGNGKVAEESPWWGISVTARLKKVLPDTYSFFDSWAQTKFRLLKMEVINVLSNGEMTDEFYFIVPVDYMTDYTVFDKLVLENMGQYCYEHSVLYNRTRQCAEVIDGVVFGRSNEWLSLDKNVMAFDWLGRLDVRLWSSTEAWSKSTGVPYKHSPDEFKGITLKQTEEAVRERADKREFNVRRLASVSGEAVEKLAYIKDLDNGVYVTKGDGWKLYGKNEVELRYRRYINGFATSESGVIYSDRYVQDSVQFTKEDESRLPDLRSSFKIITTECDQEIIVPPHIKNYNDYRLTRHGSFAWYAKTRDGIIGVVRVMWCYKGEGRLYYDDAYFVVRYGEKDYTRVEQDELLAMTEGYGTDFIYRCDYDDCGIVYEVTPYYNMIDIWGDF